MNSIDCERRYMQVSCGDHERLSLIFQSELKLHWIYTAMPRTSIYRKEHSINYSSVRSIRFSKLLFLTVCLLCIISAESAETMNAVVNEKIQQRFVRQSSCPVSCNNSRRRPVCASDQRTYVSKCLVRRLRKCQKKKIRIVHKGSCNDPPKKTPCLLERKKSMERAKTPSVGVFIPKCNRDGSYVSIQCHAATGMCWCVNNEGIPVQPKEVTVRKPDCTGKSKRKLAGRFKKNRFCTKKLRDTFNSNIIKVFDEEFRRLPGTHTVTVESMTLQQQLEYYKKVAQWKYNDLDRNKDNKLRKSEMKNLRLTVKKFVKPRNCARTFVNYCDLEQDGRILTQEWILCLGLTKTKYLATNSKKQRPLDHIEKAGSMLSLNPLRPMQSRRVTTESPEDDFAEFRYRAVGRCVDVRGKALREHAKHPTSAVFIPRCTPHGLYEKGQCHMTKHRICWCVNQATGAPLMGTTVTPPKGITPTCRIRHMKGCPHTEKRKFLESLMKKLMREKYRGKSMMIIQNKGFYEEIVRAKFKKLDKNSNRILERKEWRHFKRFTKRVVRNKPKLRKCGRNFLRYCDINNDRRIQLAEWIDCTGVDRNVYTLLSRRNGKRNPLEKYLQQS